MTDAVTTAMAPETFKLDDFLAGVAYPTEEVTIHLDAFTANEKLKALAKKDELERKLAKLKDSKAPRTLDEKTVSFEDVAEIQEVIDGLNEKLEASGLTFSMRGMEPAIVQEITKRHFVTAEDEENPDKNIARDNELIAKSIIKVTNAQGQVDEHVFTADEVNHWRGKLLDGEFLKLVQAVAKVNLNGALFSVAVDAPFPS
jgi:hypothetical protein